MSTWSCVILVPGLNWHHIWCHCHLLHFPESLLHSHPAVALCCDNLLTHASTSTGESLAGWKMQHVPWQKRKTQLFLFSFSQWCSRGFTPALISPEMWNYRPDCANYPVTLLAWFGSGDFHCAVTELLPVHVASYAEEASWEQSTKTHVGTL